MDFLFSVLFTIICKHGLLVCGDGVETSFIGSENTYYYYYDVEMEDGAYCFITLSKDTTWFYIEQQKLYYTFPKDKRNNEQFEIVKD